MKNILFALSLALSPMAMAADLDFSPLKYQALNLDALVVDQQLLSENSNFGEKIRHCVEGAWFAAEPSQDQNHAAHQELVNAHEVIKEHFPEIRAGLRNLFLTWAQHPVSRDAVVEAEMAVHSHIVPVKTAVRDAQINILNLLSIAQREAFDRSLVNCMRNQE